MWSADHRWKFIPHERCSNCLLKISAESGSLLIPSINKSACVSKRRSWYDTLNASGCWKICSCAALRSGRRYSGPRCQDSRSRKIRKIIQHQTKPSMRANAKSVAPGEPASTALPTQPTPYCPHCGQPLRWVETLPRRRSFRAPPG